MKLMWLWFRRSHPNNFLFGKIHSFYVLETDFELPYKNFLANPVGVRCNQMSQANGPSPAITIWFISQIKSGSLRVNTCGKTFLGLPDHFLLQEISCFAEISLCQYLLNFWEFSDFENRLKDILNIFESLNSMSLSYLSESLLQLFFNPLIDLLFQHLFEHAIRNRGTGRNAVASIDHQLCQVKTFASGSFQQLCLRHPRWVGSVTLALNILSICI